MSNIDIRLWHQALYIARFNSTEQDEYDFLIEWQRELSEHIGECMR